MLFQQGQSGNPAGRPRGSGGIETRVRQRFQGDPSRLIDVLGLIAIGDAGDVEKEFGVRPMLSDRVSAIEVLLDRGWKPRKRLEESGREERRG